MFSREVGTVPSRELYKFFDREGNTLVLRPDITPSIARAVSKYFHEDAPIRLWTPSGVCKIWSCFFMSFGAFLRSFRFSRLPFALFCYITLAYFEQKSTVDYIGAVQGIPVCFDAKECDSDTFPLQNIHAHQVQFMEDFEKQEGFKSAVPKATAPA